MSSREKLLSVTLVAMGSVTLSLVLYRLFSQLIVAPGDPTGTVASLLGYLAASVVCILLGSTMWKRLEVPVAEFSLIGGTFCLGLAFRPIGPNANALGTLGLVAFVMGYLILRSAASRGKQRTVFNRIVEKQMSPAVRALMYFPGPRSTASSLHATHDTLGDGVRPQSDREAAIEALRRAS